jgi:hypothetical protein
VPTSGQSWTTLQELRRSHTNKFRRLAPGLTIIETAPAFGIGQRAIIARTPSGNVLWDCIALIDDATVDFVNGVGGISSIAISHPHYYTTMLEWSRAFGKVPVYLHAADRQWVMQPDPAVQFWEGDTKPIGPGLTLIRLGGHFEGGTVLHWASWDNGRTLGRYPASRTERTRQLYVVLPKPHSTACRQGSAYGRYSGTFRFRCGLRRLFGSESDRCKRQTGGRSVYREIHCADQRGIGEASGGSVAIACAHF